jgi:hypothetical protein
MIGNALRGDLRSAGADAVEGARLGAAECQVALPNDLPGASPAIIALAQARPGEISAEEVLALRRQAPLARIVGLCGAWCEGIGRSGAPWPAVPRVAWHQWAAQSRRELAALAEGRPAVWGLAATASDEERTLAAGPPAPRGAGAVALCCAADEAADWLAAACRRAGYSPVSFADVPPRAGGLAAGIWDASAVDGDTSGLARFCAAVRPAAVLALLNFPRAADWKCAVAAGAAAVLAKPASIEDLEDELARIAAARPLE